MMNEFEAFIGLVVDAGFALVDTGAQQGLVGDKEYAQICDRLAESGLKPRILPTFQADAVGVGGTTKFQLTAEMPCAIQGVNGTLVIHVVKGRLPLLLPMCFCKKLGMVLDTRVNTSEWTNIHKTSQLQELSSGHLVTDTLEFPPGG